jgi:hypothetical protein
LLKEISMRRPALIRSMCMTLAGLGLITLGACASSGRDDGGRHSSIQGDISPELDTQTARPIDFDNAMYYTWDTNGRMFWGDVQRALLIDRPSRLSPTPSPF